MSVGFIDWRGVFERSVFDVYDWKLSNLYCLFFVWGMMKSIWTKRIRRMRLNTLKLKALRLSLCLGYDKECLNEAYWTYVSENSQTYIVCLCVWSMTKIVRTKRTGCTWLKTLQPILFVFVFGVWQRSFERSVLGVREWKLSKSYPKHKDKRWSAI